MKQSLSLAPMLACIVLILLVHNHASAQGPVAAVDSVPSVSSPATIPGPPAREEFAKRIELLEGQIEQMRAELDRLKAAAAPESVSPMPSAANDTVVKETAVAAQVQDKPAST